MLSKCMQNMQGRVAAGEIKRMTMAAATTIWVVKRDEVVPVMWRSVRIHLLRSQWLKPHEIPVHNILLWLEQSFQLSCS